MLVDTKHGRMCTLERNVCTILLTAQDSFTEEAYRRYSVYGVLVDPSRPRLSHTKSNFLANLEQVHKTQL